MSFIWAPKLFQHIITGRIKYNDINNDELKSIEEKTKQIYNPPAKVYVKEKNVKKPWFYLVYTKSVLQLCENYYIYKKIDEIEQNWN